jgi:hypothetical protein
MCGFDNEAVDMHFHLNLLHFFIMGVHDAYVNYVRTSKGSVIKL